MTCLVKEHTQTEDLMVYQVFDTDTEPDFSGVKNSFLRAVRSKEIRLDFRVDKAHMHESRPSKQLPALLRRFVHVEIASSFSPVDDEGLAHGRIRAFIHDLTRPGRKIHELVVSGP